MYRKNTHSQGQGRRSSQPQRLSAVISDPVERSSKIASEGRKTFIPRPTVRSSSVEREGLRSSSRSRIPRSLVGECASTEDHGGKSDLRAQSVENLFTPQSAVTPGPSSSRSTAVSSKRTGRRDTRPLTDRAFQNLELLKVHDYLLAERIVTQQQLQEVRCPMTTKLFVFVMNSLLMKLFSAYSVTLSNYCDQIPSLMKKLKYPGFVTRSWLLTANSPHAWPHVVGLLSWLTELLGPSAPNLKYVVYDGDVLDNDKVIKMHDFTRKRYIEWNEKDMGFSTDEDIQFCEELVVDQKEHWIEQLLKIEREVEAVQSCVDPTQEHAAEEALKKIKADLAKKTATINHHKEILQKSLVLLENTKSEKCTLLKKREDIKTLIAVTDCANCCTTEELWKLQSEVTTFKNIVKMQDTHITDLNNHCYADDLTIARYQGKLDEVRLQRNAQLRECTSKYVDTSQLHFSLNYGSDNISHIPPEFKDCVKETKQTMENLMKKSKEKEKACKIEKNKEEETTRKCKEEFSQRNGLLHLEEEEVNKQKKKDGTNLRGELRRMNEELSKPIDECIEKENLEKAKSRLVNLNEELKSLEEKLQVERDKYNCCLKQVYQKLQDHVKKSEDRLTCFFDSNM